MGSLPEGDGLVGLDLEADSLYRYSERICLVQVCYGESVELVDPLNGETLEPLVEWLKNARISRWIQKFSYRQRCVNLLTRQESVICQQRTPGANPV